ncbi:hypothetical protein HHI36_019082 [Cryptolaemus montrouzieri]|uniref:Uncharacterized protein n=1 Tax=Cryptolaemus montrouzieri TaxID=559131 RepID=A0ABD2P1W6_9CUCU
MPTKGMISGIEQKAVKPILLSDFDAEGNKLKAMNHTNIGVTNLQSGNAGYHGANHSVNQDVPRYSIHPEQLEAALLEVHPGTVMKEIQNLNKEKSGNDEGQWSCVVSLQVTRLHPQTKPEELHKVLQEHLPGAKCEKHESKKPSI